MLKFNREPVLQMLETWLSNEIFISNSTPRFLTDDEESTEQPSSVTQYSKLLLVGSLCPINNTFFQNLAVRNYLSSTFYINYAFHKFFNLVCFTGPGRNTELSIISITVKANPVLPDDISQG